MGSSNARHVHCKDVVQHAVDKKQDKFSFDVLPGVLYDMKEENARAKTGEVHS
ncbi:hypothetical protein [Peribacillus loiseleuriae]|uniref:hypothetical protein n=1 Tax=Peribacillus loiseleuriae TaxID=1679170 RepID=UPI0015D58451|nr:hypothetical protein [Peribacillus loiseleuriae]